MLLRARATVVLSLLAAGSGAAFGQSGEALTRAGSGARAAGMGDAFVAVSDDGTAASWNPAGLAQLRQPEFSLVYAVSDNGLRLSGMRSADDRVAYSTRNLHDTSSSPDFASAALPFSVARKPVTLQVGWHRLYRLSAPIGGDTERRVLGEDAEPTAISVGDQLQGNIDVVSLAGAAKLTSRAAVGVSVDFWRGEWQERISIVEQRASPELPAFFSSDTHQRVRGRSVTGGLLLTYPSWNVGLVYHAPFWSDFQFRQTYLSNLAPRRSLDAPDARFRWPRSLAGGVARRFGSRWMAAVAVTHDQWTDALIDKLPGVATPLNFFDGTPRELSTTQDTLAVNAGLEHLVVHDASVIPLRLGIGWEPQGAMDPVTRDPVNFVLLSAGAGYNTNRFKLDAAVQYRAGSFRASVVNTVETSLAEAFARDAIGLSTSREWRIKVSVIYRLADTEALKGVLRRIFG